MNKIPKMLLLVGLPGSGKSYFAKHLADHHNKNSYNITGRDGIKKCM
jgi:adenylate kinase family enzyme